MAYPKLSAEEQQKRYQEKLARWRKRYQSDPEFRRKYQEKGRRYRAEHKDEVNKKHREYYKKNKGEIRERYRELRPTYARRWKLKNPRNYMLQRAKSNSRQKGCEFALSLDDINIPEVCPYLGIPLCFGGGKENKPSIDRIRSDRGYVPGNVEIISWRANRLKLAMTLDELILMGKHAAELKAAP